MRVKKRKPLKIPLRHGIAETLTYPPMIHRNNLQMKLKKALIVRPLRNNQLKMTVELALKKAPPDGLRLRQFDSEAVSIV